MCWDLDAAQGPGKSNTDRLALQRRGAVVLEPLVRFLSEYDGTVIVIGAEKRKGEQIPADRVVDVRIADQAKQYRALKQGDLIEKDQVIGRLEWQERAKLLASEKKELMLLEPELERAQKCADEAKARYETGVKLAQRKLVQVDNSERKLVCEMLAAELAYIKAKLAYAKYRVNQLEKLEKDPDQKYPVFRSPVRGVIHRICKDAGDAVKRGETILIIRAIE